MMSCDDKTYTCRFILGSLYSLSSPPNPHWQPVWQLCPVCSLNFTVYAKMENMKEDAQYFKLLANVDDDKKRKIGKPNSEPILVGALEFWNQVEAKYIHMLAEPFAYKYDLELFGYSIEEYTDTIGLTLS